jgi:hypothetical protein
MRVWEWEEKEVEGRTGLAQSPRAQVSLSEFYI